MPPAAIPSRVFTAGSASPRRRSSSSAEAGGNFGARPKPPHVGSSSSSRRLVAVNTIDSVNGSEEGAAEAACSSASIITRALRSTSPRRSR